MAEYISRNAALRVLCDACGNAACPKGLIPQCSYYEKMQSIPAADVLPRDEAIKMGAELAAMHGSDATSQQLEEAYLKGVEDGMTRRDVRPAVRGHIEEDENTYLFCSECNCNITLAAYETPDNRLVLRPNYCPNCGADMRPEPPKEETIS